MHNLSTVFQFEFIRTVKKKSFWLMALSFPALIVAVFGIIYFSNQATNDAAEKMKQANYSIMITDEAGVIPLDTLRALHLTIAPSRAVGIEAAKSGSVDAYFYFPQDINKNNVEVYGQNISIFDNNRYSTFARTLLEQSAAARVEPTALAILKDRVNISSTIYRDGVQYDPSREMIAPGLFLVLFYFLIAMFGGQMLTSTTDEKENRVIEMILTTVKSRTLIMGKILALVLLAFLQALIIIVPAVIGYLVFRDNLSLPDFDLATIPFDPIRITTGAVIFAAGYMLFTGLLVAIGAAAPTAKEASGFLGIVMMLIFMPLYAAPLFISSPSSPLVQFLTYFPFTAPIPALLRNAVGNLTPVETVLVIAILLVSATVVMMIAVRLFRYGAIEYSKRLSLVTLLGPRAYLKPSRHK